MNTSLRKNTKYCFIRSALAKKYDKAALADILRRAESHYATLAAQCADALPGEQFHLSNTILPTAAIYKALLEADRTNALAVTHEALMPTFCESDFATYGGLPGIRFERTQTLGTGGSCCDFHFTRE